MISLSFLTLFISGNYVSYVNGCQKMFFYKISSLRKNKIPFDIGTLEQEVTSVPPLLVDNNNFVLFCVSVFM